MNLEITLRHLEHTDAIDGKIREKVGKIAKRLGDNTSFHWTSWVEHDEHISTLKAQDSGKEFFVKASADDLYKTMDLAVSKMINQLEHKH